MTVTAAAHKENIYFLEAMMFKKFVSTLLAMMLVAAMIAIPVSADEAAETSEAVELTLKAADVEVPVGTESADVAICLINVPETGLTSACFKVSSTAEILAVTPNPDLPGTIKVDDEEIATSVVGPISEDGIKYMWVNGTENVTTSEILLATVTVKTEGVEAGTVIPVTVIASDDPQDFIDTVFNEYLPVKEDGSVTVSEPTFAIAVEGGSADVESAKEGATVTITAAEPEEGKVFDKWEVVTEGVELADPSAASTTFTMPAKDVEIKATYKDAGPAKLLGDVNGDGKVNVRDIAMMMRAQAGWVQEGYVEANQDYTDDGKFNARDIAQLMRDIASGKVQ